MTSLYRQIAETLQQEIDAHLYEPTGKLPSEATLEKRFTVSRVTVRLALKHLVDQGIIERKQGKGTYSTGKKVAHGIHIMRSFHESLLSQGLNASMQLLDKHTVVTPKILRSFFKDAPNLTFIERLHLVDDEPIAVGYSHFSVFSEHLSWDHMEQKPTWVLLEESANQPIIRADIRIRMQLAGKELTERLKVAKEAPLFLLERTSWFADNQCAEHSVFYIRPEHYEFTWSNQ